jgi:hypothetical protein
MIKIKVPSDCSTIDEHLAHLWNIRDGIIRGSITDVGYNEWDMDGKDLLKHSGFDIKTDA